jgi:Asp-tRNA(Asn)/Glu-tRNA(Gln) amidotransferase A subunit family amidase
MNDLNFLSAVEMAVQVRARVISPVELVDAHLGRIAELNCGRESKLNAYVHVDVDAARAQAKIAEAAVGSSSHADSLGVLHGVPISVKSSVDVAGWPCECGSRLRKGYVPSEDGCRRRGRFCWGIRMCRNF